MKNNNLIGINDRVKHSVFGEGNIMRISDRTTTVLFDDGETRTFTNEAFLSMHFSIIAEDYAENVKIQKILVRELFESLNYDIEINTINNVSILSAPNGCGKTTIFKLLDFIFNPKQKTFLEIKNIPFDSFSCVLSNGCTLSLSRRILESPQTGSLSDRELSKYKVAVSLLESDYDMIFSITDINGDSINISYTETIIDDRRSGVSHAYYDDEDEEDSGYVTGIGRTRNRRFFALIDIATRKYGCRIELDFIVANRLQKTYISQVSRNIIAHNDTEFERGRVRERERVDYLRVASDEIAKNIKTWIDEYNGLLEDAKNKLPLMYINAIDESNTTFEQFKRRWNKYHSELDKFYKLGLLEPREAVINSNELQNAFIKKTAFLITYLDAFEGTLAPLQNNYEKLKLFADIFHKRNEITQKSIRFTPNGIEIYSRGKKIDIDCLSSGEKNDFVMFYRLIFNTAKSGVVLIDEPEISLHIEWQEEYLDRLIEICEINYLQAIVATHSPNIVNGHFDLFVDKR